MWEKILLNLLSNAFKFAFEGQITVELRGTAIASSPRRRYRRRHPSVGPSPHFERFYRVEHSRGGPTKAPASDWRSCRSWPASMAAT